jgi:hypothetical protein
LDFLRLLGSEGARTGAGGCRGESGAGVDDAAAVWAPHPRAVVCAARGSACAR